MPTSAEHRLRAITEASRAQTQAEQEPGGSIAQLHPPHPIAPAEVAANPMTAIIQAVIEDIAQGIENKLGIIAALEKQGGPYKTSLILRHENKLREAAAAALEIVISHPALRPAPDQN
jgi:hypothetical protein